MNVRSVHINSDYDKKLMYVELDDERAVKTVFARVADLAKDKKLGENVKVINYFPSVAYQRKQAILGLIRTKKQTRSAWASTTSRSTRRRRGPVTFS